MIKTILKVEGMACGMCEAHVNDAVRKAFSVKKVTSSQRKGETQIVSAAPLDEEELRSVIGAAGYTVGEVRTETYEKKGLFSFLK